LASTFPYNFLDPSLLNTDELLASLLRCVQVFLDVTDIIDYNVSILNINDLSNAFFCIAKDDPTVGFPYDAARLTGHLYPKTATEDLGKLDTAYTMRCGVAKT
jgi:hypothetical protein